MSEPWSIEAELRRLADGDSTELVLRRLGLLLPSSDLVEIREVAGWRRGGAETYIYEFVVVANQDEPKHLVLKALVGGPAAGSLSEQLEIRLQRRRLLHAEGVSTPTLYAAAHASFLEDHVPYPLWNALTELSADSERLDQFNRLVRDLVTVLQTVDRLRFAYVDVLTDLRTDLERVYMIDFGQDLGAPGEASPGRTRWLEDLHNDLPRLVGSQVFETVMSAVEREAYGL